MKQSLIGLLIIIDSESYNLLLSQSKLLTPLHKKSCFFVQSQVKSPSPLISSQSLNQAGRQMNAVYRFHHSFAHHPCQWIVSRSVVGMANSQTLLECKNITMQNAGKGLTDCFTCPLSVTSHSRLASCPMKPELEYIFNRKSQGEEVQHVFSSLKCIGALSLNGIC